jgi:DNA-binding NarL/FixJ family response regulator
MIKATAPETKTILLTGMDEAECTRQAFACGVDGLVLKIQPSPVLIATINYLARGASAAVSLPGCTTAALNKPHRTAIPAAIATNPAQSKWPDGLTEREREVVRLISEGLSNKDIADRLCISSITVRHHLTSIFDKLGVSNRQKLLIRAHQNGLTRPPAMA